MISIRPANNQDVPALVDILKVVGLWIPSFDYSTMSQPVLVAEADGRVIGFMQGYLGAPYAWIIEAAVLPEYQDRGVTSALMAEMERVFKACGAAGWIAFVRHDNDDCRRKIRSLGAHVLNHGSVFHRSFA